jgi:hypothetical protein
MNGNTVIVPVAIRSAVSCLTGSTSSAVGRHGSDAVVVVNYASCSCGFPALSAREPTGSLGASVLTPTQGRLNPCRRLCHARYVDGNY